LINPGYLTLPWRLPDAYKIIEAVIGNDLLVELNEFFRRVECKKFHLKSQYVTATGAQIGAVMLVVVPDRLVLFMLTGLHGIHGTAGVVLFDRDTVFTYMRCTCEWHDQCPHHGKKQYDA